MLVSAELADISGFGKVGRVGHKHCYAGHATLLDLTSEQAKNVVFFFIAILL